MASVDTQHGTGSYDLRVPIVSVWYRLFGYISTGNFDMASVVTVHGAGSSGIQEPVVSIWYLSLRYIVPAVSGF